MINTEASKAATASTAPRMISANDKNDKDSEEGETDGGGGECSGDKCVDEFDCR